MEEDRCGRCSQASHSPVGENIHNCEFSLKRESIAEGVHLLPVPQDHLCAITFVLRSSENGPENQKCLYSDDLFNLPGPQFSHL